MQRKEIYMVEFSKDTVAICMATFNGEKYIAEQLQSIIDQSYKDWVLFVKDDNSNDNTKNILLEWSKKYKNKIIVINDANLPGGGAAKNFVSILNWVNKNYSFNYYMFSDQDDVWLQNKITLCLKAIKELEAESMKPILVHTDLYVVDKDLTMINKSFIKYSALNPKIRDLRHFVIQNNVTGCTMLWNKSLNDIIRFDCDSMVMHDWWIALVAASFGQIYYVSEPTTKYRQHSSNVLGAKNVRTLRFLINKICRKKDIKKLIVLSVNQSSAFLHCYSDIMTSEQIDIVKSFSTILEKGKAKRVFTIIKGRYYKQGLLRKVEEFIYI